MPWLPESATVTAQYLMPKTWMTEGAGWLASHAGGKVTTQVIESFIRRYQVDMSEAAQPDPASYETFNDFFTRALKPGLRPIADAAWVCPVDGAISQLGDIRGDQIYQAKGHQYTLQALLGGDPEDAKPYVDGHFATIYLSPKDYHRIHMPADGLLVKMIHVPGDLFSVNPATARGVPGLFARNERVVCFFESDQGPFTLTLVAATIVGGMSTVWHGQVNEQRLDAPSIWDYRDQTITLPKGAEMGRFFLGSTVVMTFPRGAMNFAADWQAGTVVRMGRPMGVNPSSHTAPCGD